MREREPHARRDAGLGARVTKLDSPPRVPPPSRGREGCRVREEGVRGGKCLQSRCRPPVCRRDGGAHLPGGPRLQTHGDVAESGGRGGGPHVGIQERDEATGLERAVEETCMSRAGPCPRGCWGQRDPSSKTQRYIASLRRPKLPKVAARSGHTATWGEETGAGGPVTAT